MKTKILLADDFLIVREGLKNLLTEDPELEVVGEASNGQQAVERAGVCHPNVVLMDVEMPVMDGIEATRTIRQLHPDVQVLILTHYESEEYLFKALEAGACGYVVKQVNCADLISAVKSAASGLACLSPLMTRILIQRIFGRQGIAGKTEKMLSPREQEVFKLLAEGSTSQEIGKKLFISTKTVETHRSHIMEKLKLSSRTDLVKYAIREGIISLARS